VTARAERDAPAARPPGSAADAAALAPDPAAPAPGRLRTIAADAAFALAFLTVVPVRTRSLGPRGLAGAAAWFPLVGAAVGALAGGVRAAFAPLLGPTPATLLALVALVAITGALHQDGLADTADGLGVRGDRERRLAAMRDSALGAYGVLALIAWALLMLAALQPLPVPHALAALIAAAALARWAALVHAVATPPARPEGLGATFEPSHAALATATATALLAAGLAAGPLPGLAALGATLAAAALSILTARRALGGRTGDTLGATVALAELLVCLALLAVWR
jgi:adenosylcobinamide-GDP ribazoletransferase